MRLLPGESKEFSLRGRNELQVECGAAPIAPGHNQDYLQDIKKETITKIMSLSASTHRKCTDKTRLKVTASKKDTMKKLVLALVCLNAGMLQALQFTGSDIPVFARRSPHQQKLNLTNIIGHLNIIGNMIGLQRVGHMRGILQPLRLLFSMYSPVITVKISTIILPIQHRITLLCQLAIKTFWLFPIAKCGY